MEIVEVLEGVKHFFSQHLSPVHKVTSIEMTDSGWDVFVEVIEESEYMKSHAKDQIIGVYHIQLNESMKIIAFKRQGLRQRSSIPQDG
ncbi:gas vesicle protein GvpO [Halalkalibacter alkaliphilus]|uniref:Gas vesicle protein n=1 Tax=Halalkalibacter alkaliphilus TaxID=2917993 RepID=A0A9X1ZWS8_9BACI|nr:gas vesicle protein GvpO [Halalkalibacter alkaliphilus]MCL7745806.1 gas vesicle protein [Halalkalibacter alkaliphilus]